MYIILFLRVFRGKFQVKTKTSGNENILLENDAIRLELDSVRGLLKVKRMRFYRVGVTV